MQVKDTTNNTNTWEDGWYFDFAGRGEAIRLLLYHAGVKFEDVRVKREDWPKYKDGFELQQMPVLEIDGKRYCQSYAIMEFLGAKYGYLPKSYEQLYRVLNIMNTAEDLARKAVLCLGVRSPYDAKGREEQLAELRSTTGPVWLQALEKKLKENCTQDFLAGRKYTIADFYVLGFYAMVWQDAEWSAKFMDCLKTHCPTLLAYAEKRLIDFSQYYKKCKPRLTYFNIPGRAEMLRILLKHAGVLFEDIQLTFPEWMGQKASGKFELQQVPTLACEHCGVNFAQSDALMHRFGVRFGYLPHESPEKLYRVVWWCNTIKDLLEGPGKFLFAPIPEEQKKAIREEYFTQKVPTLFAAMEQKLKENKTQLFLVGKKLGAFSILIAALSRIVAST